MIVNVDAERDHIKFMDVIIGDVDYDTPEVGKKRIVINLDALDSELNPVQDAGSMLFHISIVGDETNLYSEIPESLELDSELIHSKLLIDNIGLVLFSSGGSSTIGLVVDSAVVADLAVVLDVPGKGSIILPTVSFPSV